MMPASNEASKRDTAPGLVVYGYVLASIPDEIEIAALHKEIAHFCRREGYRLEHIITDREVADDVVVRPGFAALLEALELDSSHGVVLMDADHLSRDNAARAHLYRAIRRTASLVIPVFEAPDDFRESGA